MDNRSLEMEKAIQRLSNYNQELDFHNPTKICGDLKEYLDFYDFNHEQINLHFGKITVDELEIIVQIFAPKTSNGTVILLHGYLDHVGSLKHIIHNLNANHYTVVSYDLRGHGLSDGQAASVNAFTDYVLTLETLMDKVKQEMDGPFYVIGHSTGGAIATNYLLKHENHPFDKVILVAPLIRSNYWYPTILGTYLMKAFPFIKKVKRHFRKNSANNQYLQSVKKDPLQPKVIPLNWTEALMAWNGEVKLFTPVMTSVCVIQGTNDETVDWKYNLSFLTEKFPYSKVAYIEKGRHALFNESKRIREQVTTFIHQYIQE